MTLAEIYNKQNSVEKKQEQPSPKKELVIHMPEVAMLIKHLDLLYTKMLMQDENKQVSWFNNGQGIKQSESIN
jgi:hypothetical protein|tara:strand:- start:414 stop:632 length:219 start_codon:yes stop_codon:yes gene_type:complete